MRDQAAEVVDNDDGTWSYSLAFDFDPTAVIDEPPLTWSYAGQARYSWKPEPIGEWTYVVADLVEHSVEEQLLATTRDDDQGRLWEVSAVDVDLMDELIAKEDADSLEVAMGLDQEDPSKPGTSPEPEEEPPGMAVTWTPNSWTFGDCDNSGGLLATDDDNHYWQGDDDRVQISTTGTPRRKAMVEIEIDGVSKCSGTILRQEWVLTAAHCLYDDDHNLIPSADFSVVRRDGVDSTPHYGVATRTPGPGFNPPGDPKDDYALLHLSEPLMEPFYDMDISASGDSTLGSLVHPVNYSFPEFAPDCSSNYTGQVVNDLYMDNVEGLGSIYAQKINLKMDGGPGHSGSPVFFCPGGGNDEACDGDELGMIISVWSGWDGILTTAVGAKGPEFRGWAINQMDGG